MQGHGATSSKIKNMDDINTINRKFDRLQVKDCVIQKNELKGKNVFAIGDIHGDVETMLNFLRKIGLVVNENAVDVDTLVNWGNIKNTVLIFCGDLVDRKRMTGTFDNQTYKVLCYQKQYLITKGTDGEIPMEEIIILKILRSLHENRGCNRIVVIIGNHDFLVLSKSTMTPEYITDLSILSNFVADDGGHVIVQTPEYDIRNAKCSGYVDPIAQGMPAYREKLHKCFYDIADCVYTYFVVDDTIFSHAGFLQQTLDDFLQLNIKDPNAFIRFMCNPSWSFDDMELSIGDTSIFLKTVYNLYSERFGVPQLATLKNGLSLKSIGFEVTVNKMVFGHNCRSKDRPYEILTRYGIDMIDTCSSRAFDIRDVSLTQNLFYVNSNSIVNGNITYFSMLFDNKGIHHDDVRCISSNEGTTHTTPSSCYKEVITMNRDSNNTTTVPILAEQKGLVVVGDICVKNKDLCYVSRRNNIVIPVKELKKTFLSEM